MNSLYISNMLCNDIFLLIIRVLMHPFPLIQLKTDVMSELITSWIEYIYYSCHFNNKVFDLDKKKKVLEM